MSTLSNVETGRGQANPPSVRVAPDTIPEAKSSQTGVSVKYVPTPDKSWYVFRASYGREDRASDYIVEDGTFVYIAKRYTHKSSLTVSCKEMENFIIATCNQSEHLKLVTESQCHFKGGETVKVIDGMFKGVEGRVARVSGQQRVILSLSNVGLISTAYIPTAFLRVMGK